MYCKHCGTENNNDAVKCKRCQESIVEGAAQVGNSNVQKRPQNNSSGISVKSVVAGILIGLLVAVMAFGAFYLFDGGDESGTNKIVVKNESDDNKNDKNEDNTPDDENNENKKGETEENLTEDKPEVKKADYKSAYAEVLNGYIEDAKNHINENARFSLIYIDEDDIPELAVHIDTYGYTGVSVYTFHDGKAVNIAKEPSESGEYGRMGGIAYEEKGNVIYSWFCVAGGNSLKLYKIENGTATLIADFVSNYLSTPMECWYGNEKVSIEKYKEAAAKHGVEFSDEFGTMPPDGSKAATYDAAYNITKANIRERLGWVEE